MTKDDQFKDLYEKLKILESSQLMEAEKMSILTELSSHPAYDIENLVENPKDRIDMIRNVIIEHELLMRHNCEGL